MRMKYFSNFIKFHLPIALAFLGGLKFYTELNYHDHAITEGCTIGVVSGNSTPDGRPILWKIRDNTDLPDNEMVYDTTCQYKFIAVVNSGDTNVWMGVNEKGLAIVNSTAKDLPRYSVGYSNGELMRYALGSCSTVKEFEKLLVKTNENGRRTRANFGLIDATGAAVIFETSGKEYWRFDTNDEVQAPKGYLIRTNFSFTGGGTTGLDRYKRTKSLTEDLYQKNILTHQNIIKYHFRDFSNQQSEYINIPFKDYWQINKPFGYINSTYSVCRNISISASVFHGVLRTEPAKLTTMWTALGQPAATVVLPYWPIGQVPEFAVDSKISPLYQIADDIKSYLFDYTHSKSYLDTYKLRDDLGYGIWDMLLSLEDSIVITVQENLYRRLIDRHSNDDLLQMEYELSALLHTKLKTIKNELEKLIKIEILNEKSWKQENDLILSDGSIIQMISVGDNSRIDLPIGNNHNSDFGFPGGDDYLIGINHYLGENFDERDKFYFPLLLWINVSSLPHKGDKIYLRIFDSNNLLSSTSYGNSQIYEIGDEKLQKFNPIILAVHRLAPFRESLDLAVDDRIDFELSDNFPNPFNTTTKIKYTIPDNIHIKIEVFNSLGQLVETLIDGFQLPGVYDLTFNASNLSSGIYYYRLSSNSYNNVKRMVYIK